MRKRKLLMLGLAMAVTVSQLSVGSSFAGEKVWAREITDEDLSAEDETVVENDSFWDDLFADEEDYWLEDKFVEEADTETSTEEDFWLDDEEENNTAGGFIFDESTGKLTITEDYGWSFFDEVYIENAEDVTSVEINMSGSQKLKNVTDWNSAGIGSILESFVNVQSVVFTGNAKSGIEIKGDFLFSELSHLTYVDFSGLANAKMKSMSYMFDECTSLTSIDLSELNTQNVTDMASMFEGCSALQTINFGKSFTTKNVTSMRGMFMGCSSLKSLDLSSFDTSDVESMHAMFSGCGSLTSLNLSSFDTSKVTSMGLMFMDCNQIKEMDIRNFDFANIAGLVDMEVLFCDMDSIEKITVPANMPGTLNFPYTENLPIELSEYWQGSDGVIYERALANVPYAMTYTRIITNKVLDEKEVPTTPGYVNPNATPVQPGQPVQPIQMLKPVVGEVSIAGGKVSATATNIDANNTSKLEWQIFDRKTNKCIKTDTSYATNTVIYGVNAKKIYYIKCRAVGYDSNYNYVYSDWSEAKYFVTQPKITTKNKHVGKNQITIKWKKIPGAKSYTVYTKKSTSKKWIKVKTTKSNTVVLRKLKGKTIDTFKNTFHFTVVTNAKAGKKTIKSNRAEYYRAYSYYY